MNSETTSLDTFGNSLWPIVRHGQRLRIAAVPFASLQCGDLVVYLGARIQVCHRVLQKREIDGMIWFFLKGDAKLDADGWVPSYRVIGKVVSVDSVPTSSFWFRLVSGFFYWHSKCQWIIYSSFCRWAQKWHRPKYKPNTSIASQLFTTLTAPWQLLRGLQPT